MAHILKPKDRDSALFDGADVEDVAVFEWRQGAGGIAGLVYIVGRIVRRKRFLLSATLALGILSAIYAHHHGHFSIAGALVFFQLHPIIAPFFFVMLYALLSVLLLPTLPLNLAAGMLWGWLWGTVLTLFGMVLGASLAFLIARYLGRVFVTQRLHGKHWQLLWRAIETRGWKAVAFARINPIFPSAPLNYFFGLTGIGFWPYFFSTLLFILPPSLFFAVLGDSVGGIVLDGAAKDIANKVLVASAAVTALVVLKVSFKHFTKKNLTE